MDVNLAAPVVQLQVPFAMMLHEKFTMLQLIGSTLMLGGSFVTQSKTGKNREKARRRLLRAYRYNWTSGTETDTSAGFFTHASSPATSSPLAQRCATAAHP
jgi:hypothetical protein